MYGRRRRRDDGRVSIHLAVVGLPRLLADLVASAFRPEDDVEVDLLADDSAVRVDAGGPRPPHDAVVAGLDDDDPFRAQRGELLARRPGLVLIGLGRDGHDAWIYELRPVPRPLGPIGPGLLRAAVLGARGGAAP